ncbi:hypothetical protein [Pseudomonas neuropathica]|uniref:Uncharacterized protein n=1 Tax=Pseudomonas neuropathica TaxID=2730425 RepID=A0ACC7MTQ7_9PSED
MAKQSILLGTAPTGVGGDTPRTAFTKAQSNFDELYAADLANYKKNNVVGAVSQTSGVPTGAIIEQGTNANGSWTKFADGTMICSGFKDLGSQAFPAIGNLFYTGAFSGIAFPLIFVGLPKVNIGIISSGGLCWVSQGSTFATTSATSGFYVLSPAANSNGLTATYMAIGRWF